MQSEASLPVIDNEGQRGRLLPYSPGPVSGSNAVSMHLENGQSIQVPAEIVALQEDEVYAVALSFREIMKGQIAPTSFVSTEEELRIPIVAEEIVVTKHMVDTGRVRITKKQPEYEETVDEPLIREEVDIERVAIN